MRELRTLLREMEADVVHFHDERDCTVHKQCDSNTYDRKNPGADDKAFIGDFVQGYRHNLGRKNEIGPDRA